MPVILLTGRLAYIVPKADHALPGTEAVLYPSGRPWHGLLTVTRSVQACQRPCCEVGPGS